MHIHAYMYTCTCSYEFLGSERISRWFKVYKQFYYAVDRDKRIYLRKITFLTPF